jgi:hypothetical protein
MQLLASWLTRGERSLVIAATVFGLIASIGLMAEKSVEPTIRHSLLWVCNGPGLLLAAILFWLLGGFSIAHGETRFFQQWECGWWAILSALAFWPIYRSPFGIDSRVTTLISCRRVLNGWVRQQSIASSSCLSISCPC